MRRLRAYNKFYRRYEIDLWGRAGLQRTNKTVRFLRKIQKEKIKFSVNPGRSFLVNSKKKPNVSSILNYRSLKVSSGVVKNQFNPFVVQKLIKSSKGNKLKHISLWRQYSTFNFREVVKKKQKLMIRQKQLQKVLTNIIFGRAIMIDKIRQNKKNI